MSLGRRGSALISIMILTACASVSEPAHTGLVVRAPVTTVERVRVPPAVPPPPVAPTTTTSPPPTTTAATPATSATSATVPSGPVTRIILDVFGPTVGPKAVRVARCESGLDPRAYNDSGSSGIFQIHAPSWRGTFEQVTGQPWDTAVWDPYWNTVFAKWLYDRAGWDPWVCGGA